MLSRSKYIWFHSRHGDADRLRRKCSLEWMWEMCPRKIVAVEWIKVGRDRPVVAGRWKAAAQRPTSSSRALCTSARQAGNGQMRFEKADLGTAWKITQVLARATLTCRQLCTFHVFYLPSPTSEPPLPPYKHVVLASGNCTPPPPSSSARPALPHGTFNAPYIREMPSWLPRNWKRLGL